MKQVCIDGTDGDHWRRGEQCALEKALAHFWGMRALIAGGIVGRD